MIESVNFTVPGVPKGKARPRITREGRAYTPQETVMYENLVCAMYRQQVGNVFLNGAIQAEIRAFFPIPKATSKKKRATMESGLVDYTHKSDSDNIAKIVLDALNHIAYYDDAQISRLIVQKKYGHMPRVEIRLTEVEVLDEGQ